MAYSILIVDDSPAMCAMIGRILDLSGLEIAERRYAHDGEDALAQLQAHPADLVLTDINMPRMDGEEFMRRLGTDSALGSVPVVVVSTDGTAIRRRRMLALGARGYLVKPFQPEALRLELERVLENRDA
jgi:two-component system chemotaxis response regulator CheY